MSVNLDDYREDLIAAAPEIADTLDGAFHEAARVMSPVGLKDYLDGARGMVSLGKGPALVTAYLDEMPLVAKECGEAIAKLSEAFADDGEVTAKESRKLNLRAEIAEAMTALACIDQALKNLEGEG